jgi:hypothetical protein
MTKTIFIFTLMFLTWNICYSQADCDYVFSRTAIARPTEWNQFKIELKLQLKEVKNHNDSIIIVLDTSNSNKWIIHNNHKLNEPKIFELLYKDTIINKRERSIYYSKNLISKSTNVLMTSYYNSEYCWNMDIILYSINQFFIRLI